MAKKYKIVHDIAEHSYTLCAFEKEEAGKNILIFEAESYEEAMFIKNQFLHFEPYRPFDTFWIATVGHFISVDNQLVKEDNYEVRTVIVLAKTEIIAKEKIIQEAITYSQPYKNQYDQDVVWKFDRLLSLEPMDFFHTIDLYQGKVVEIKSERIHKI